MNAVLGYGAPQTWTEAFRRLPAVPSVPTALLAAARGRPLPPLAPPRPLLRAAGFGVSCAFDLSRETQQVRTGDAHGLPWGVTVGLAEGPGSPGRCSAMTALGGSRAHAPVVPSPARWLRSQPHGAGTRGSLAMQAPEVHRPRVSSFHSGKARNGSRKWLLPTVPPPCRES